MNKNYFYILILAILSGFFIQHKTYAQSSLPATKTSSENIEGLSIYPNPVSDGRVYIDTKGNSSKDIALYNILGKKVLATTISGRELLLPYNISPGVYIISIKEKEATATRKIVIK